MRYLLQKMRSNTMIQVHRMLYQIPGGGWNACISGLSNVRALNTKKEPCSPRRTARRPHTYSFSPIHVSVVGSCCRQETERKHKVQNTSYKLRQTYLQNFLAFYPGLSGACYITACHNQRKNYNRQKKKKSHWKQSLNNKLNDLSCDVSSTCTWSDGEASLWRGVLVPTSLVASACAQATRLSSPSTISLLLFPYSDSIKGFPSRIYLRLLCDLASHSRASDFGVRRSKPLHC